MDSKTEKFGRSLESLTTLFVFVENFLSTRQVSQETNSLVVFVAEELFTNMVKYNPKGPPEVTATISVADDKLILTMEDKQDSPFDPTQRAEVNTSAPLEERRPGGLGIHLISKMMDEFSYSYENGISRTTAVRYLEKKHA